ncbi:MAG TPA: hypothetical protein VI731_05950 [Bacteroidia bacterium]|nr:hypothetical protein [Bacteroidia bacterium]
MRIFLLSVFVVLSQLLIAQLPSTEIWLFRYDFSNGNYVFDKKGRNISNHPGYDNQPSFSSDGNYLLWSSQRDSMGTDIFLFHLKNNTTTRFTQTAVSEYSPVYAPGDNFISCVVVEEDSTQRLYRYNKKTGVGKALVPAFTGVGYHCWFNPQIVYFFKITEPSSLHRVDIKSCGAILCDTNIGRCMQVIQLSDDEQMLLYTKMTASGRFIVARNIDGNLVSNFSIPVIEDSQDFVIDRSGNILMAKETKLFKWSIGTSTTWTEVADFSESLHKITRLALSPDGCHLALVDNLPAE